MTNPFFTFDNGVGVLFDGTCGFGLATQVINDKHVNSIIITPLDHQQTPGPRSDDDNPIITDGPMMSLAFTSKESVDVLIGALNTIKEKWTSE